MIRLLLARSSRLTTIRATFTAVTEEGTLIRHLDRKSVIPRMKAVNLIHTLARTALVRKVINHILLNLYRKVWEEPHSVNTIKTEE